MLLFLNMIFVHLDFEIDILTLKMGFCILYFNFKNIADFKIKENITIQKVFLYLHWLYSKITQFNGSLQVLSNLQTTTNNVFFYLFTRCRINAIYINYRTVWSGIEENGTLCIIARQRPSPINQSYWFRLNYIPVGELKVFNSFSY